MYKRKFPKTNTVVEIENNSSQLKTFTNSLLSSSTPVTSNNSISNDVESPESPSMINDLIDFPEEKKKKTVNNYELDDSTDCSQPLFNDDDNDTYSYLKQTLISCGLHLKCDQNILCKLPFICIL